MRQRRRMKRYERSRGRFSRELFFEICKWILTTAVSVFCGVMFIYGFGIRTRAVGESMEPLIYNGQSILVDRARYLFLKPAKDSVIVFLPNGNTASHYYIKRVVGLPGEKIQIINNELYVNGVMAYAGDDTYDLMEDAGIAENEITLKDDEYFVLGDNRNASEDSRSANIGPVKRDQIVGAAWFKFGGSEGESGFVN